MNERTFKLVEIFDLRPYDFETRKRIPLDLGDGNECDRCGRLHAVVWVVNETTPGREREWKVGSRCGPRLLDGWVPEKAELKEARRRERARAELEGGRRLIKKAIEMGRALREKELTPPRKIVDLGISEFGAHCYGFEGVDTEIGSDLSDLEDIRRELNREHLYKKVMFEIRPRGPMLDLVLSAALGKTEEELLQSLETRGYL